jgi:stage II sporulation protein AA (anti-sigma F factor antagonist)
MKKGSICISRATDSIKRVFELSGIFKIIKIYDTIEEAVQSI